VTPGSPSRPPGPVRIAVDALGGDHAPRAVVEGVLAALQRDPEVGVSLVGDRGRIEPVLAECGGAPGDRLSLVHASQTLAMAENPVAGLRSKPDNSISRMLLEVHEGRAAAAFSAGNTGGVVAASTLHLARLRGVKRSGIAVPLPTRTGSCLVIDVGANIYCRPIHLVHYAHMAAAYSRAVLGIANPRVGLLNIGEEEQKGTSLVKETAGMLRASGLNFVGNIEGHAIFQGAADVVVCEGFVGNIVLKTTEGLAESILAMITDAGREAAKGDPSSATGLKQVLGGLKSRMDYAVYGGAPLLGFEGVVLIGHGRSSAEAVANAVRTGAEFVRKGVNEAIRDAVRATRAHAHEGDPA
jgi:glycerol-3-phosphate acyltransferase PlsX